MTHWIQVLKNRSKDWGVPSVCSTLCNAPQNLHDFQVSEALKLNPGGRQGLSHEACRCARASVASVWSRPLHSRKKKQYQLYKQPPNGSAQDGCIFLALGPMSWKPIETVGFAKISFPHALALRSICIAAWYFDGEKTYSYLLSDVTH